MGDKTRRFLTPWMLALAVAAVPARAETECDQQLSRADSAYQTGRFDEALGSLAACLDSNPPRAFRVPVLALMAKVQLAIDDRAAARATISSLLRIDSNFAYDPLRDPPIFLTLVDELRQEDTTVKISSVSKTPESLREAPATVAVVTAEQIAQRGYTNIEQLLHDLPGFDISQGFGKTYANVYQRGFRSEATSRTLFLVDGVEENNLWDSIAYISRQYPLINVERVEVIYGPAATMYGANAFAGVVNVITKKPVDLLQPGRRHGVHLTAAGGSFNSSYLEGVIAGRNENETLSWSITGRTFSSDEHDLSRYEDWDYDPAYFQTVDYGKILRLDGAQKVADFESFLDANKALDCRTQEVCEYRIMGDSVVLTEEGLRRAIELDQAAYFQIFNGAPIGFANPTEDSLLRGTLQLPKLEVGFQTWTRRESNAPNQTDRSMPGGEDSMLWIPKQTWLYVKYSQSFMNDRLLLSYFSRYKRHELAEDTFLSDAVSYNTGLLGLRDLVMGREASWVGNYYYLYNSQLRNELSVVYTPSAKFNLVTGIETRDGSIQGGIRFGPNPTPSETGTASLDDTPPGNRFDVRDLGLYAQASYKPREDLKLVAGGRIDNNKVRATGGFGSVFNPRLALIYMPRDFVFKAIYSEAFQDAPNFQKYVISPPNILLSNPNLEPEKVENLELSGSWQASEDLSFELVAYDSSYSSIVGLAEADCNRAELPQCPTSGKTLQYQGIGALKIRGVQATASARLGRFDLLANYTFTDPLSVDPDSGAEQRIGDIASHQVNLDVNASFWDRLGTDLRVNYVGSKETGKNTTISDNPLDEIDSYTVAHFTLTYKDPLRHLSRERLSIRSELQLIVNNLFDAEYSHPGARTADGTVFAASVPQPERFGYLRFSVSF
jgi:outer membrane receptor protein involved in Fe transport